MPAIKKIKAYKYSELENDYKNNVKGWLDETEYEFCENDEDYFSPYEWDETEIEEHCECNEYWFSKYGRPVHQLIIEEDNGKS